MRECGRCVWEVGEYSLFCRALLQKRPMIWRRSCVAVHYEALRSTYSLCACVCVYKGDMDAVCVGGGSRRGEETNLSLGIKFLEKICFFERLELSLLEHAVTLRHTQGLCLALFQIPCFPAFSLFDNSLYPVVFTLPCNLMRI